MRRVGPDEVFTERAAVAESPSLWVQDGFADAAEIDAVLGWMGDERNITDHAHFAKWDETGFVAEVPVDVDPLLARILARIDAATGRRCAVADTLRFRYYNEGEGHPAHCDAYEADGHKLVLTSLLYLVAPDEGGETTFLAARPEGVALSPRPGRLACWTSTLPDLRDDPASVHAGEAVRRGAKAVLLRFAYAPVAR